MKVQENPAPSQFAHSVLLQLPEMPQGVLTGQDDVSFDMFNDFRRLGLDYLDENGEQLEFSAGEVSGDDEDHRTQNDETESVVTKCSDSDNSTVDPQLSSEWLRDAELNDYWPYPSRTVSET